MGSFEILKVEKFNSLSDTNVLFILMYSDFLFGLLLTGFAVRTNTNTSFKSFQLIFY